MVDRVQDNTPKKETIADQVIKRLQDHPLSSKRTGHTPVEHRYLGPPVIPKLEDPIVSDEHRIWIRASFEEEGSDCLELRETIADRVIKQHMVIYNAQTNSFDPYVEPLQNIANMQAVVSEIAKNDMLYGPYTEDCELCGVYIFSDRDRSMYIRCWETSMLHRWYAHCTECNNKRMTGAN